MTLFQIGKTEAALARLSLEGVDENGELTPEASATIDQWFEELRDNEAEKLDGYYGIIRTFEIQADAATDEAKRFQAMASSLTAAATRLKTRIKDHLERNGRTEAVSFKGRKFSVVKNGGKQQLDIDPTLDPSGVDPEFQVVKIVLNNDRIREALQEGVDIPFARLKPRGSHIQIHQPRGAKTGSDKQ